MKKKLKIKHKANPIGWIEAVIEYKDQVLFVGEINNSLCIATVSNQHLVPTELMGVDEYGFKIDYK
jgi:hypothetical protein